MYRPGLEHSGFGVVDLEAELDRLVNVGVRIVLPATRMAGGGLRASIEGPDDMLQELMESA